MIYVVLGQPRSGTHLVMSHLVKLHNLPQVHYSPDYKFNYTNDIIVHTHDPFFTIDSIVDISNIHLTVVKRRDLFAQLMSCEIAQRSGQWTSYQTQQLNPFIYNIELFTKNLLTSLKWYNDLDLGKMYNKIEIVYYEDFLNNNVTYTSNKSPYNYKSLVINWNELKKVYDSVIRVYNIYGYLGCIQL